MIDRDFLWYRTDQFLELESGRPGNEVTKTFTLWGRISLNPDNLIGLRNTWI